MESGPILCPQPPGLLSFLPAHDSQGPLPVLISSLCSGHLGLAVSEIPGIILPQGLFEGYALCLENSSSLSVICFLGSLEFLLQYLLLSEASLDM